MKKLLLLSFLLFSLTATAQNGPTLYLSHYPVDYGVGLRADYQVRNTGLYSSVSYGNWGVYKASNLKHHIKLTTGLLFPLPDYHGASYNVSTGINYHHINSEITENSYLNPKIYNHWSFELGLTIEISRVCVGMRTDIIRWEPCVDFGYRF